VLELDIAIKGVFAASEAIHAVSREGGNEAEGWAKIGPLHPLTNPMFLIATWQVPD
jgi:hypothetical protein